MIYIIIAKQFKYYADCFSQTEPFLAVPLACIMRVALAKTLEVGTFYTPYAKGLCAFPSYHDFTIFLLLS